MKMSSAKDSLSHDRESHLVLEQESLRKKEEIIAMEEAKKRSEKHKEHDAIREESEKHEMERAKMEMKQRNAEMQLVKDHEMDFEKQITETFKAKTQDEAAKGQRWEEERKLEDLEMEEKIKTRQDLLKKKLVDLDRAREEAEAEARSIEATKIAASKAFQEKNIKEIAIDEFLEKEQKKKEERIQRNEKMIQKKDETDRAMLESEVSALAVQKEIRAQVLELQKAEFNRFEKEIKGGTRTIDKNVIETQIEKERSSLEEILERQKVRDLEKERKTEEIAKDSEMFVAMQANKQKSLQSDRKLAEEMVSLHHESLIQEEDLKRSMQKERLQREKQQREQETEKHEAELLKLLETQKQKRPDIGSYEYDGSEEERLRLEALKKRQQQQEQIMNQHEKELELLMKSRDSPKSARDKEDVKESKKKGFFSNLFGKR